MRLPRSLIFAGLMLVPLQAAVSQTSGGTATTGTSPSAGRASPGAVGESLNHSNPNPSLNPSVSGTSPLPNAPGTNNAGTALPSGSSASNAAGVTTGSAGNRTGARVGGVNAQGPNKRGDDPIPGDPTLDKKIKSICRGC